MARALTAIAADLRASVATGSNEIVRRTLMLEAATALETESQSTNVVSPVHAEASQAVIDSQAKQLTEARAEVAKLQAHLAKIQADMAMT